MLKLPRSDYEIVIDKSFPTYWKATNDQLESALYDSDIGEDEYYTILSFSDIKADFDSWTPEDRAEYLQDSDTPDYTVYDWIRDCMMNSLCVVSGFYRKNEPTTEAIINGKSGSLIVLHRYGQDDYSAWWTDKDHLNDETYGSSVRGTLMQIMDEMKDEL